MNPTEKFQRKFCKPKPGRTLIVGSQIYGGKEDRRKAFPNAVGVDMLAGPGVDIVANLEETDKIHDMWTDGAFAHVECRSVLEHSRRPWRLASNVENWLMDSGSTIDISVPFVWRVHAYPSDYWRFTVEAIRELFPSIEWTALMYVTQSEMTNSTKTERIEMGNRAYFARSEVMGFGVKR